MKLYVRHMADAFKELMKKHHKLIMLGEDICDPYGGAFKCTRGLSTKHPKRVINMPIAEASIVGMGIGLALQGYKPIVEIMFGDFMTLAFDQLLNGASKFKYIYDRDMPLIVRTPMGGYRGYGATHSQTLDKHFLGIPGLNVYALNRTVDPKDVYSEILEKKELALVIENKLLYNQKADSDLHPTEYKPDLTIVCYGGMADLALKAKEELNINIQICCPTKIYPINMVSGGAGKYIILEEGQGFAGWGSEVMSQLYEDGFKGKMQRVYAKPFPIPCAKHLEHDMLPSVKDIKEAYECM